MNAPQSLPGINSVGEAELVIADLGRIMDALLAAVEEETVLVRAGKLSEAERLSAAKSELAGTYLATTERIKASRPFLSRSLPDQLAELRRRHDSVPRGAADQPHRARDRARSVGGNRPRRVG